MYSRRETLLGALALGACAPVARLETHPPPPDDPRFAAIEARIGGRVGVFAIHAGTGAELAHRPHERFALCSTFKWLLGAQVLQLAQAEPGLLGQTVRYREDDLLDYAPVTRARFGEGPVGSMRVEDLCAATIVASDNTAANLLLDTVAMGPEGFTRFLRANGDTVTRLDRRETALNDVIPGDERDTTTPDAMARTMRRFLLGDAGSGDPPLDAPARAKLNGWLEASATGAQRLRAGFPSDWRAGDKTGTWNGARNATNDVAIAWPPASNGGFSAPIIIACYLAGSTAEPPARNAAHAQIARIVVESWS